jgi:hypothetical protein
VKVPAAPAPVTEKEILSSYERFRLQLNPKRPLEMRKVFRQLGCDHITVTRTGPKSWSFEGEFDLGRLVYQGADASAPGV